MKTIGHCLMTALAGTLLLCRPASMSAENEKIKFHKTDIDTRGPVSITDSSARGSVSIHLFDSDMYVIKIEDRCKSMVYISCLELDCPERDSTHVEDEVTLRLVTEGPDGIIKEENIVIH